MVRGRNRWTARAIWMWTTILVAGAVAALSPSAARSAEPEIVARVNGEPVTRDELQRMLADPAKRRELQQELGVPQTDSKTLDRLALRKLINRRLLLQEARRRDFTVTEQDLDQAIVDLRGRFKDLKEFGAWMHARRLDDRSLFDTIRADMLVTRVRAGLLQGMRVTDEQVQEYYEAHKDELTTSGRVRLRIIAVKDQAAAQEILAALQTGEDFQRLARERSIGIRAAHGGDTGWVALETLPPLLRQAVGALKVGEASGPLPRGAEFLIVGLAGRRPGRPKTLDEARAEIEGRLLPAKHQEVFEAWLKEQEEKSKIEVFP